MILEHRCPERKRERLEAVIIIQTRNRVHRNEDHDTN